MCFRCCLTYFFRQILDIPDKGKVLCFTHEMQPAFFLFSSLTRYCTSLNKLALPENPIHNGDSL